MRKRANRRNKRAERRSERSKLLRKNEAEGKAAEEEEEANRGEERGGGKRTELEEGTPDEPTTLNCWETPACEAITGDVLVMPMA